MYDGVIILIAPFGGKSMKSGFIEIYENMMKIGGPFSKFKYLFFLLQKVVMCKLLISRTLQTFFFQFRAM